MAASNAEKRREWVVTTPAPSMSDAVAKRLANVSDAEALLEGVAPPPTPGGVIIGLRLFCRAGAD